MLRSVRYRRMVRAIVAASELACVPGFEEICPYEKSSGPKPLGPDRFYTVHATRRPVPDEWVAVFRHGCPTVRPSLFTLAQILRATPVSSVPAVLATV